MSTIFVEGLEVSASIGVYDAERQRPQQLELDPHHRTIGEHPRRGPEVS